MGGRGGLLALWLALPFGCTAVADSFRCSDDSACTAGGRAQHCERSGLCSLDDTSCPSGTRYHSSAGELGGSCVPERSCLDHPQAAACLDFETQPAPPWRVLVNSLVIDNNQKHRGLGALRLSTPTTSAGQTAFAALQNLALQDALAQPSTWLRVWLHLSVPPAAQSSVVILKVEQSVPPHEGIGVVLYPDRTQLGNPLGQSDEERRAPEFGQWACYLMRIDRDRVELSGSDVATMDGAITRQPSPPLGGLTIPLYVQTSQTQPAIDMWVDDVLVTNYPIGCED